MNSLQKILTSFQVKENLNPKIWEKSEDFYTMNSKVREKLLEISDIFIEYLKIDIVISDIIMTGSLSNYNWSDFSDVDLHIIVDFNQFPKEILPLYEDLFKLKKTLFNDSHDIKIYNYEVELYVQNEEESHFSSGVYSVLHDEWINEPQKEKVSIDKDLIKVKSKQWMGIIDNVIKNVQDEPIEEAKRIIEKYKDKLKKYRTCGLQKGGEYSDENLVFKVLRRNGYIQKLFDFENEFMDKKLSLKESEFEFRKELDKLGVEEKGNELTSGGNVSSDLLNITTDILRQFKKTNPFAKVTITSGNDTYHKKLPKSLHNLGKAIDVTVSPNLARKNFKNLLNDVKSRVSNFNFIDEYENPSSHATGGHFHLELRDGDGDVTQSNSILDKKISSAEKSTFLQGLKKLALSDKSYSNMKGKGSKIPYIVDVEYIQTGLQFLGYSLPKWGVDGLFGPETEKATKSFQKAYGLDETGVFDGESLKYLYVILMTKDFTDSDLSKIQKKSDFSDINVGNDNEFYEEILKGIGAPITDSNLKFLYAWRQAEGGKATNNPFNTTFNLKNDSGISNYNKVGVKNYSSPQYGVEATVKTLSNNRYSCIVNGLKNDIGADEISKCNDLKTWGTGEMVAKVLSGSKLSPPQIYA